MAKKKAKVVVPIMEESCKNCSHRHVCKLKCLLFDIDKQGFVRNEKLMVFYDELCILLANFCEEYLNGGE